MANPQSNLTKRNVRDIRRMYGKGNWTFRSLGEKFGVSRMAIYRIVHEQTWKHVK